MSKKCTRKIQESTLPKEIQELFKKTGRPDPTIKKYKKGNAKRPQIIQDLFNCSSDNKLTLWEQLETLIYAFQYGIASKFGDEYEYAIPPEYTLYGLLDDSYEGEEELLNEPKTWLDYYRENFQNKKELPIEFVKRLLDLIALGVSELFVRNLESGRQTEFNELKEDFEFLWDIYKNHLPSQKGKKLIRLSACEMSNLYGTDDKGKDFIHPSKATMYHVVLTKAQRLILQKEITDERKKKVIILAHLYREKKCTLSEGHSFDEVIYNLLDDIQSGNETPRVTKAKNNVQVMKKI